MDRKIPPLITPIPTIQSRKKAPYAKFEKIYQLETIPVKIIEIVMVVSMVALALLMAFQVLLRYVVQLPFLGIEEMAPLFAVWVYFLAVALTTRERSHIGGGIVTIVCKNAVAINVVRLFGSIICFVTTCIISYFACRMLAFNINLGRLSSYMRIPRYFWDVSLIAGFGLSGFYFFLQILLETFNLFVSGKEQ